MRMRGIRKSKDFIFYTKHKMTNHYQGVPAGGGRQTWRYQYQQGGGWNRAWNRSRSERVEPIADRYRNRSSMYAARGREDAAYRQSLDDAYHRIHVASRAIIAQRRRTDALLRDYADEGQADIRASNWPELLPAVDDESRFRSEAAKLGMGGFVESLFCPITHEPIRCPAVAADGHSYERSAIQKWIAESGPKSPNTLLLMESTVLYPNHSLRCMIQAVVDRCASSGGG